MENNISQSSTPTNLTKSKLSPLYLTTIIFQLAVLVLWFVPTLKASIISNTQYFSGSDLLGEKQTAISRYVSITQQFEGLVVLNLIYIALMVLSIVFLFKPNLLKLSNPLIWTEISVILNLLTFFVILIFGKSRMREYADIGAEFKLSIAGWLFLLFSIILFVLTSLLAYYSSIESHNGDK